jgi:transposase IS66 family protein
MPLPENIDGLSPAELKLLVVRLLEEVVELRRMVAAQRDEIARLKGGAGRPDIKPNRKPSGMEQATDPKSPGGSGRKRGRRGATRTKLTIDETRKVTLTARPRGGRFKGYTSFVVQELMIRRQVLDLQCERWQTADGKVITAPLPNGFDGHFGPQLRRFVLALYHQGQTTMARLLTLLRALGIVISKRQVVRLLTVGHTGFRDEAREVLRVALANSAWITVDDTGARHHAKNGFCTQLGNARFTAFITSESKSRLNFLGLLRAGYTDYVVNDEAIAYMRERALAGPIIARLTEHPARSFADQAAWTAHLEKLGIAALKVNPDPVLIATEGALWGSVKAHGLMRDIVIISDDAGQFNVGEHGLCWVHAERLVHKLDTFTEQNRAAQAGTRAAIWQLYADLKAYRGAPSPARKGAIAAEFDRIFTTKTGFVLLDRLLARLHANKAELLKVLERPEIPLHTNGSENDIRCHVTRRKISGGTRSDSGRNCRDTFLALAKTCAKLGISFWDYLGARFAITGQAIIPPLPNLFLAAAQTP